MKVLELTGVALGWAVAKCEGRRIRYNHGGGLEVRGRSEDGKELPEHWDLWMNWLPSTDWAQGGPIIEREEIGIKRHMPCMKGEEWEASGSIGAKGAGYRHAFGPTPLIAAMRCYVASKLGNDIELPEELK